MMKTNDADFNLRDATNDDIEFIFQLRIQTMKKDFDNTFGWHEGEQWKRASDEIQHAKIIMMNQTDIGVIKVIPKIKELHLHQMQILPEYQGRGIGSKLVSRVLDRAGNKKIPVTLFVLKGAAAKRIYDRFGFSVTNEYENNYMMRWQPKSLYGNIEYRTPTVAEYNKLRGLVGWWETDRTATDIAMRNSLFSVVCIERGSVIGLGRIIGDGLYFYIQDLIIHPDYQSKGLGKTLMKELMGYISTNAKAGTFVGLMAAKGLEKYYKQFGFKARDEQAPGMYQIIK